VKLSGFELKQSTFAGAKDLVVKKENTIERLTRTYTRPWKIDQLHGLMQQFVTSRRRGRVALVEATIYPMPNGQRAAGLPYTEYVLRSKVEGGRTGYGRFYGSLADAAAGYRPGTSLTLVQPLIELEGTDADAAVLVIMDDALEPVCAIAIAD
jgi:hypothetical protein